MSRGAGLEDSVGRISVQELHDHIRTNNTSVVSKLSNKKIRLTLPDGRFVKITRTLETFFLKGVKCRECGMEGDYYYYFPIEDKVNYVSLTLIAFLMDSHGVVRNHMEFTSDHTIPSCHRGSDFIENREPMCSLCNHRKDDSVPKMETVTLYRLATLRRWVLRKFNENPQVTAYSHWHRDYMTAIFTEQDPNLPKSGSVSEKDVISYCKSAKELFGFNIPYERFGKRKPVGTSYRDTTGVLGYAITSESFAGIYDCNLLTSVMDYLNKEDDGA